MENHNQYNRVFKNETLKQSYYFYPHCLIQAIPNLYSDDKDHTLSMPQLFDSLKSAR